MLSALFIPLFFFITRLYLLPYRRGRRALLITLTAWREWALLIALTAAFRGVVWLYDHRSERCEFAVVDGTAFTVNGIKGKWARLFL